MSFWKDAMRRSLSALTLCAPVVFLAACGGPAVPDSGAGVGFEDYSSYAVRREAALNNGTPMVATGAQPIMPGGVTAEQPLGATATASSPGFSAERVGAAIDRASEGPQVAGAMIGAPVNGTPAPEPVRPSVTVPLPVQKSSSGPNIVQFALSTSHAVGTPMYPRSSLQLKNADRACAAFSSSDQAQIAFLQAGGPEKDRKGLDPDGDGYACSWTPVPFRAAMN